MNRYSQYNEEGFIDSFFKNKNNGFLVDIGAADGITNSNSRFLIEKGWGGILIEPNTKNFNKLQELYKNNKKVILENTGCSNEDILNVDFYVDQNNEYEQLSTFSQPQMIACKDYFKCEFLNLKSSLIKTSSLFENHSVYEIDFLSIDTESYDTNVILGIDFSLVKISLICVEHDSQELRNYLEHNSYEEVHRTIGNIFFKKN